MLPSAILLSLGFRKPPRFCLILMHSLSSTINLLFCYSSISLWLSYLLLPLSTIPDLMTSISLSTNNRVASGTKDSHSTPASSERKKAGPSLPMAASNEEDHQGALSLEQETSIQPDQGIPSPGHPDVSHIIETPQAPDEESQKPQNLLESGTTSQSSLPLSSTPIEAKIDGPKSRAGSRSVHTERNQSLSNTDTRDGVDIHGSSSISVERNKKSLEFPASKKSNESLHPLSSIASTDEVKSRDDKDAPNATHSSPNTRKTITSSSSSSSSEEGADSALSPSLNHREESVQPDSVESRWGTSQQGMSSKGNLRAIKQF